MDTRHSHRADETRVIIDAMRQIQSNPELEAEARTNPPALFDRLGLTGIARQAVAAALAIAVVSKGAMEDLGAGEFADVAIQVWWFR